MKTINSISQKLKISALFSILAIGIAALIVMTTTSSRAIESPQVQETIEMDFLVNKGEDGFEQRMFVEPLIHCLNPDSRHCAYDVTEDGKNNIPQKGSYTTSEIDLYVLLGWIQANPDSGLALYNN